MKLSGNEIVIIRKLVPRVCADMNRTTFFGGRPLAKRGMEWPTRAPNEYEQDAGITEPIALHFVCQIDFSQIVQAGATTELPDNGILYLFYALDMDDVVVEEGERPFWKFVYEPLGTGPFERLAPSPSLRPILMGGGQPGDNITTSSDEAEPASELSYIPAGAELAIADAPSADGTTDADSTVETEARHFPESVRHARCWLAEDLPNVRARIKVLAENMASFEKGQRDKHPRIAFFKELKAKYRRSDNVSKTDDDIWLELTDEWRSDLVVFKRREPQLESLVKGLTGLDDRDRVPEHLRSEFRDQLMLSTKHSVLRRSWNEDTDRLARQYLLSRFSLEELPFSENEVRAATDERKRGKDNRDQILGVADEVQNGSRDDAFAYAKSMAWAKPGQTVKDMTLLLQIDTCWAGSGMQWADAGKAYFYIFKDELVARRFDHVAHALHGY